METNKKLSVRWAYLAVGVITMLFAGILYAWSILKVPFAEQLKYENSALALNYTLTMCFFCIGGLISGMLVRKIGTKITIMSAGFLAGLGYFLCSILNENSIFLLYVTYAVMCGLGIGMAYIAIISGVNAWFPDKKGVSFGALMMGFGASSLFLGKIAEAMFNSAIGWRNTYMIIGIALCVVIGISALIIRHPDASVVLPQPQKKSSKFEENFEVKDYKPIEMLKRFTFWRGFVLLLLLTAVGNSVISFTRDLALSVGAEASLATTLVGVIAVFNGLGRIVSGAVFDVMGRKFVMLASNVLAIIAATVMLIAVNIGSLSLCIVGLCLIGLSYGTSPTLCSAFTSSFYGTKYFSSNLSIINCNLIGASFVATACSELLKVSGEYNVPFILLLAIAVIALGLNVSIKKP